MMIGQNIVLTVREINEAYQSCLSTGNKECSLAKDLKAILEWMMTNKRAIIAFAPDTKLALDVKAIAKSYNKYKQFDRR